jgi:hypothetical protein
VLALDHEVLSVARETAGHVCAALIKVLTHLAT